MTGTGRKGGRLGSKDMGFLSARNIRKAYDGIVAVDDVSFDVEEGELVTLLGPSGSGKTTVLMCVAGFVDPDGGDIALRGRSIGDLPPHKRNIGMMFQQYALFPHMTVLDNVAYPLTVRRVGVKERTAAVMEALALREAGRHGEALPKELSGGQQQRVALARALVFKPPILLMDEPLGALDRKLRAEMQMEIRAIQRKVRITTLYVTHDQEEALTISDRIGVMHEGRLVQIGRPMEMYDRPVDIFVADFLGEANILHGRDRGGKFPRNDDRLGRIARVGGARREESRRRRRGRGRDPAGAHPSGDGPRRLAACRRRHRAGALSRQSVSHGREYTRATHHGADGAR